MVIQITLEILGDTKMTSNPEVIFMGRESNFRQDLATTRQQRRSGEKKRVLRNHKCEWGILTSGILMRYACSRKATIRNLRLVAAPPESDGWRLHIMLMEGQSIVAQSSKAVKASMPTLDPIELLPHQALTIIATPKATIPNTETPYTLDYFVDIE